MARIFEDGEINGLKIVAEDQPKSVDEVCGFMGKALTAVFLAFFSSVPKMLKRKWVIHIPSRCLLDPLQTV